MRLREFDPLLLHQYAACGRKFACDLAKVEHPERYRNAAPNRRRARSLMQSRRLITDLVSVQVRPRVPDFVLTTKRTDGKVTDSGKARVPAAVHTRRLFFGSSPNPATNAEVAVMVDAPV